MSRIGLALLAAAAAALTGPAAAQQPARPTFQTTKVDGTEGDYIFRYQGHQSMFVVTKDGVIATDPISYGRPQAATAYIDEIKKITDKPIKYLFTAITTTTMPPAARRSSRRGRESSRTSAPPNGSRS